MDVDMHVLLFVQHHKHPMCLCTSVHRSVCVHGMCVHAARQMWCIHDIVCLCAACVFMYGPTILWFSVFLSQFSIAWFQI